MDKAHIEIRRPDRECGEEYARLYVVVNDRVAYSCLYDARSHTAEEMALESARQFMADQGLEEQ